jgi:hypothetical protein
MSGRAKPIRSSDPAAARPSGPTTGEYRPQNLLEETLPGKGCGSDRWELIEMAVGYRAIARLADSEDAISAAESELSAWLTEKKQQGNLTVADWAGEGEYELGPNAQLTVVHDPDRQDNSCRRLYRLREINSAGMFTVSLSALSVPQAKTFLQSLVVDVDVDAENIYEAVGKVAPPRLMRRILEAHQAMDGETPLTGEPQVVRGAEATPVLAAILDQTRTASVIVAPLPWGDGEDEWRTAVRSLTTLSVGVASTFILDDSATALVSAGLSTSHGIQKGVIRTFAPQVDLESPEDALRHPKLYPATLLKYVDGGRVRSNLQRLHARSTRLRFVERELPLDVRRGLDILFRAEAAARRTRDVERTVRETLLQPEGVGITDDATTQVPSEGLQHFVSRWLGSGLELSDATFADLDRLLERKTIEASRREEDLNKAAETQEQLESALRESKSQLEALSFELAVAEESVRKHDREVTVLRHRLVEYGKPELTYVEPESDLWDSPDDILSLLDRISPDGDTHLAFSRIEFTGDIDKALEVDVREPTPRYAHAFWDYVHVLYDYAEGYAQGRISVGVHLYLTSDNIGGHKCPPDRHASGESDTTLNRWGNERILPVPTEVDPSGTVLMAAHFKPTWRDTFAPRMHYYIDINGTGKIYIGYIGRHLTTKDT